MYREREKRESCVLTKSAGVPSGRCSSGHTPPPHLPTRHIALERISWINKTLLIVSILARAPLVYPDSSKERRRRVSPRREREKARHQVVYTRVLQGPTSATFFPSAGLPSFFPLLLCLVSFFFHRMFSTRHIVLPPLGSSQFEGSCF